MNAGSLIAIGLLILTTIAGLIKPSLLSKLYHDLSDRKFILGTAVFACLVFGTIFIATQSPGDMTLEANHGNNNFNQDVSSNEVYGGPIDNLVEQQPAAEIPVEQPQAQNPATHSNSSSPQPSTPSASPSQQASSSGTSEKKCDNPQVKIQNFRLVVCIP